jgi:putative sterol carrier protein
LTRKPLSQPEENGMALQAKQLIDGLFASFLPEQAAGIDAKIQVQLAGEGGGDWILKIADSKIAVSEGKAAAPRLTLMTNIADLAEIVSGRLDPMAAFMQGKLKLTGDLGLAMRLVGLFKRS